MISAQEAYKQTVKNRKNSEFWGYLEKKVMEAIEDGNNILMLNPILGSDFAVFLESKKTLDTLSTLGYNYEIEHDFNFYYDDALNFKLDWQV